MSTSNEGAITQHRLLWAIEQMMLSGTRPECLIIRSVSSACTEHCEMAASEALRKEQGVIWNDSGHFKMGHLADASE